jgi:DNA-binding transcriptional ArsR family regulator
MRIISNTPTLPPMRPTANPQSALRNPLNHILGTEANIRVLRVLAERSMPISAAELSRRTQLQRSTVSRSLKLLDELGVIHFSGVAPKAQVVLREPGLLSKALRQLFKAERSRFDALMDGIRTAASKLRVISVWIGPTIGLGIDRIGDPVPLYILDRPDLVALNAQLLRQSLERLERRIDVTFDINEVTVADFGTSIGPESLEGTTLVVGIPPLDLFQKVTKAGRERRNISSHSQHDASALQRGRRIAAAIKHDPTLVEKARQYIEKRSQVASPGERRELLEWLRVLKHGSPAAIRKLLTDSSPRATRLRQTLPFLETE